jgi:acyl-coenzyme A synthetase/AMP-(fatty) acid ligase
MHVVDMVFFWARTEPHKPAVIQTEMVTTFQGLADAIESIGERVERLGLDRNEPIAVSIANPSYFVAAAFAVLRSGYSVALVQPALFPQLQPAGIRNLIYDTQGLVLSGGRNIRFEMSWLPVAASSAPRRPYRDRPVGDVSIIAFTSGTTGLPKAHVQSKVALEERFRCPVSSWTMGDHKRGLIMPGLASRFGFNRLCDLLFAGKTACFASSPEDALWLINTFDIDTAVVSPQQALQLAEVQETKTRYPALPLTTLRVAGAKAPPEMIRKLRSRLCRNIVLSYASTEGGPVASAPYDLIQDIPDAVGFVVPGVDLEVVDESGATLPAGSDGLIRLRTPHLRLNADANRTKPGDPQASWFYPGDTGHLTEHGVLCISGRSADVINSGGVKVSATKIEQIAEALPQIKEAGVCGIMGPAGIEEIWIAVVPAGLVDPDAVKRHFKESKDVGLIPAEVFVVDKLPRGDLGKIQRYRLREQLLALSKVA